MNIYGVRLTPGSRSVLPPLELLPFTLNHLQDRVSGYEAYGTHPVMGMD